MIGLSMVVAAAVAPQHPAVDPAPRETAAALSPALPDNGYSSLTGLFSTDDYPVEALKKGEQGTVAVRLTLSEEGRVADCTVTASSRSAILDAATCAIIQRRGRFPPLSERPAMATTTHARIRWVLPPAGERLFADQTVRFVFAIDRSGPLPNCRVEGSAAASSPAPLEFCAPLLPAARDMVEQARKRMEVVVERELVLEQGLLIGTPESADQYLDRFGDALIRKWTFSLSIDADGKVVECDGPEPPRMPRSFCSDALQWRFMPIEPEAANRSLRSAVQIFGAYLRPKS